MPAPAPWHQIVTLKPELRTGELSLSQFAADLHEVVGRAGRRALYEDPEKFFALTYPTFALRDLARDVAARLAGRSDRAVRQLEMTYGGGKTHALITLHHLFSNPDALPDLQTVREFREHADVELPNASTAALCFDKIDVERGVEQVRGPKGETRTLLHPWSILAFQLAGAEGLRILQGEDFTEERDTAPAEPLLVEIIERQQEADGRATLILLDEVMMYARAKAAQDPSWVHRLQNFFQALTQAVAKVDRAAVVASLLATDPAKTGDAFGKAVLRDLANIFQRQREEGIQPVQKSDVAEVLRRRFFEPDSFEDPASFKAHVIGIVKGIARIDETTRREQKAEEGRFLESFPFHPDLTDVFYTRWTEIEGFQRTRGILRTLAIALRDAEAWCDPSPLIGPSVLLDKPVSSTVSGAVRELAGIATKDTVEGRRTDWVPLLEKEIEIARQAQEEFPSLGASRELEQAVVAVFLHSQPIGRKAQTNELLRLAGGAGPDAIELRKGLRRWRDTSWFLNDEDEESQADDDAHSLPGTWRLGNKPNLRQMHDQACTERVAADAVNERLRTAIGKTNTLWGGAKEAGASVHKLPRFPSDVKDDVRFRFVILGPGSASSSGKPSMVAKRFLDQTTGPDSPRSYRNAVVLAVPSREGVAAMRSKTRSLLGWEDVEAQLSSRQVDPVRRQRLRHHVRKAENELPGVIRQAYGIVVTVSEKNKVHAFKLPGSGQPLFKEIKGHKKARIVDTPVNPEALLPKGPFDLWEEGEDARLASQLSDSFARFPRLPKVLKPELVTRTVLEGVRAGLFVARLKRPDGSARTWWLEDVDSVASVDDMLEIVLPAKASLARMDHRLLKPGRLPSLWQTDNGNAFKPLVVEALLEYFAGGHVAIVPRDGYEEDLPIPACSDGTVRDAVKRAVEDGTLWITNPPATAWKEPVPAGTIKPNAKLRPPPNQVLPSDLTEEAVPDAWSQDQTNGLSLTQALCQKRSSRVPWGMVREGIGAAVNARWLVPTRDSASVDCTYDQAQKLVLKKPEVGDGKGKGKRKPTNASPVNLDSTQLQDLAERVPDLLREIGSSELRFGVLVSASGQVADQAREKVNEILNEVAPDLKLED
ncbi:MAG: DUF499 domain-containing protein [Bryobacterales bacterium]|nr:DUF499 domain-containing protein [Bryobacterales bacterium]